MSAVADDVGATTPIAAPRPVSFAEAFRFWLKLGFISFGGPAGQIAIMHQELVERKRWISEKRFLHALNYCMVLPGPEAQQLATYIGWLMHRTWGGIVAGGLFVLPSLFILVALSWIYMAYGAHPVAAGVLYGIKPAVTAIVLFAAWRIASRALKNWLLWSIAILAFVAIFALDVPFPLIVIGAGAIGWIGGRLHPAYFTSGGGHKGSKTIAAGPSLIDDTTPTPPHALFRWSRLATVIVVFVGTWAAVLALLWSLSATNDTLAQMAWFFTKAALLTFGGAYAVLPYVFQGAVEHHHWLTATQMIDGLALGETTPGPLIMVVAFVGFVGGWTRQVIPDSLFWSGALAATVVTFFTFLPSFFFILVGGPLIETTHNDLKFTAPLTAITAAVVGVIVNLAVFFGYHVLWPHGFSGRFEGWAAAIGILAAIALFRFKIGVIPVIGASALAGLVLLFR
nr:chromate transport protein ChrA [uncultured bacterium]